MTVLVSTQFKKATSRYIESSFLDRKFPLNRRKPLNNSLQGKTNTKEVKINQKGTRMVKVGED